VDDFRKEISDHLSSVMTAKALLRELAVDSGQLVNSFEIPLREARKPEYITITERLTYQILPTKDKPDVCRDVWSATYVFDADMTRADLGGFYSSRSIPTNSRSLRMRKSTISTTQPYVSLSEGRFVVLYRGGAAMDDWENKMGKCLKSRASTLVSLTAPRPIDSLCLAITELQ